MQTIVGKQFPGVVIPKIDAAKDSIKIIVFDWRWYPNDPASSVQLFNQAIVRAVRRGVRVCAISNSADIVGILKQIGVDSKKLIAKNLVHAKVMIIDDKIAIVGSHNYTQHAFSMNYELSVLVEDEPEIQRIIQFFNNLYA